MHLKWSRMHHFEPRSHGYRALWVHTSMNALLKKKRSRSFDGYLLISKNSSISYWGCTFRTQHRFWSPTKNIWKFWNQNMHIKWSKMHHFELRFHGFRALWLHNAVETLLEQRIFDHVMLSSDFEEIVSFCWGCTFRQKPILILITKFNWRNNHQGNSLAFLTNGIRAHMQRSPQVQLNYNSGRSSNYRRWW